MRSSIGDTSVTLWVVSALVALLAGRVFADSLRRLVYEGPLRAWRDLLVGSLALTLGLWGAMALDISAQGLLFEIGFHPLKLAAAVIGAWVLIAAGVVLATYRNLWYTQMAAALVLAIVALVLQVAIVWSIGAEPGLIWRRDPLLFAVLLSMVGFGVSGRMITGVRRGSSDDRRSRRLLAALVLAACCVASQELVIASSGLDRQVVSAHARVLPELVVMLVAGAAVPIGLVLLLVDQRAQQRVRASERARRKRPHSADPGAESMFSEDFASTGLSDRQGRGPHP